MDTLSLSDCASIIVLRRSIAEMALIWYPIIVLRLIKVLSNSSARLLIVILAFPFSRGGEGENYLKERLAGGARLFVRA